MPVKGGYLILAGGGALLVWSGLKGKSWSTVLRDIMQGKKPSATTTAYTISSTAPGGANNPGLSTPGPGNAPAVRGMWNHATLMALWVSAGGPPGAANNAACHAMQESSGNARITSGNPDGGVNVGLWQLDTRGVGAGYSVAQLQNPYLNARITVRATGGGANWSAWATPGCL